MDCCYEDGSASVDEEADPVVVLSDGEGTGIGTGKGIGVTTSDSSEEV